MIPITSHPLPRDTVLVLQRAIQSGGYEIRVLANARNQLAVIAGERHVKRNDEEREAGLALRRQFQLVGLEGLDFRQTWGGRLFGFWLKKEREESRHLAKGDSTIGGEEVRTMLEAELREVLDKRMETRLEELRELEARGGDVRGEIEKMVEDEIEKREGIHLEAGHQFSLAENLLSLVLPISDIAFRITAPPTLILGATLTLFPSLRPEIAPAMSPLVYVFGGAALFKYYEVLTDCLPVNSRWRRALRPQQVYVSHRNKTMSRNIARTLQERPESPPMLALVGMAHVQGLAAQMISEYQFREILLPEV